MVTIQDNVGLLGLSFFGIVFSSLVSTWYLFYKVRCSLVMMQIDIYYSFKFDFWIYPNSYLSLYQDAVNQPSLVIVYFGGNDSMGPHSSGLGPHVPLQEYIENMRKITTHLKVTYVGMTWYLLWVFPFFNLPRWWYRAFNWTFTQPLV